MNLKAFKKTGSKAAPKASEEKIEVEVLEIIHSDGRKVTITNEDMESDAMLGLLVQELEDAVKAESSPEDLDKYRDGVINRYQSLTQNNTATVGDLLKDAKKEKVTEKVEAKKKEEKEEENDLPINLEEVAPHIGKIVVCHIVRPNMHTTKVGKKTVPTFGYVVTDGTTEENEKIPNVMIHSGNGFSLAMKMAIKDGCIIKGELDWDSTPNKERYVLLNPKIVQAAEVADSPVSVLSKWLNENTAYDAENGNVRSISWISLTKAVKNIHPSKIADHLSEEYKGGFILATGRGNSREYFYEK